MVWGVRRIKEFNLELLGKWCWRIGIVCGLGYWRRAMGWREAICAMEGMRVQRGDVASRPYVRRGGFLAMSVERWVMVQVRCVGRMFGWASSRYGIDLEGCLSCRY